MYKLKYGVVSLVALVTLSACATNPNQVSDNRTISTDASIPRLLTEEGRHQLLVDGKPYLILGAQTNNSANYLNALKDVWPVVDKLHANTLSIPVAWEQVEPQEGQFDFRFIDDLLSQAKAHNVRLNLLWFATWKNNAPHYAPEWVKLDNSRFPRVETKEGKLLNSLSPNSKTTLEADKKAFVKLMQHLKEVDTSHQVIMVQVENEVGTYGSKRDFSERAQAIFERPVPESVTNALGLKAGTWQEVFGDDADEFFHAWSIARYVNEIAEAGKAVKPLPMNVNVALRNPFNPGDGYSMGGPTDNVLDLWKVAAPSIDIISPDIYFRDHRTVSRILELYARSDNPLYVSEIGNAETYARYFFPTLGQQGIGFVPFGMDLTDYANYPLGAKEVNDSVISAFAENYILFSQMSEAWAAMSFEHPVWGFAEPEGPEKQSDVWNAKGSSDTPEPGTEEKSHTQHADLGLWDAEISYGREMFWIDPPKGNTPVSGGAAIVKLSDNEFIITAYRARVTLSPSSELKDDFTVVARVEEGHFDGQEWIFERVWNGDQTDWGLNFTSQPHILKVKMAKVKK